MAEVLIRVGTQISSSYFKTHLENLERIQLGVRKKMINWVENEVKIYPQNEKAKG